MRLTMEQVPEFGEAKTDEISNKTGYYHECNGGSQVKWLNPNGSTDHVRPLHKTDDSFRPSKRNKGCPYGMDNGRQLP